MRTATHATRTRREHDAGIYQDATAGFDELVAYRLGTSCCDYHAAGFDRVEHVKNIARVVEAGRKRGPVSGWPS